MTMLDPNIRRELDGASIAHLATLLPDGSPHCVPIWIGTFGDRITMLTGPQTRKARNLRRDPRVAISLTAADDRWRPMLIRGSVVEWLDGDAGWEIIDRMSMKYLGQLYPREDARVVALIEPEWQSVS